MRNLKFLISLASGLLLTACSGLPIHPDQKKLLKEANEQIKDVEETGLIPYDGEQGRVALFVFHSSSTVNTYFDDSILGVTRQAFQRTSKNLKNSTCILYYSPKIGIGPTLNNCESFNEIFDNRRKTEELSDLVKNQILELNARVQDINNLLEEHNRALVTALEIGIINNQEVTDIYKNLNEISETSTASANTAKESAKKIDAALNNVSQNLDQLFIRIDNGIPEYR